MEQLIFALDERLANAGDTLPLAGHIDEEGYSLGDHDFSLPSGIDYDLVLTNVGEGILATGMLRAHVVGTCDRCLEPAEFDVDGEVDGYYLFEEPVDLADDEDEADYELVSEDDTIDLSGALVTALVMETPFVVLCREDCKGLCPVCGQNLNIADCGHMAEREAEREAERLAASPFAVLASLDLSDSDEGEDKGSEGSEEDLGDEDDFDGFDESEWDDEWDDGDWDEAEWGASGGSIVEDDDSSSDCSNVDAGSESEPTKE